MIYTDYGVLTAEQRQKLLAKISRALRPGGVFIFDVLNDRNWGKARISPGWEIAPSGFWAPKPYIALFRPHIYEDEKVMLSQHIVIDEQETVRTYHFWTQFFSDKMLEQELNEYPFQDIALHNDVLPGADEWSGKNLTFCRCVRN